MAKGIVSQCTIAYFYEARLSVSSMGVTLARHLSHIINPLKQYLSTRFVKQWKVDKATNLMEISQLPAPLHIAQLRGDAILKNTFFDALEQKQIIDPQSQQYAWQQLIISGRCLQEIMEGSGATAFFHLDTHNAYAKQCYHAYCIVLWDAAVNNDALKEKLTTGLVNHYLPTLYPSKAKEKTPEQLRKEVAKVLTMQWGIKPDIKESFTTSEDEVTFSLIAKLKGYSSTTLLTLTGKRLNITRIKTYKACLKQLQSETIAMPNQLTARKQTGPKPLS